MQCAFLIFKRDMQAEPEEQDAIFQEEEVCWAKIRGYPWWPGFIDQVHEPGDEDEQPKYTVFFFGDNTQQASSVLGASKLRKFYDNYIECYQKSLSHRKLLSAIQKAEDKLRQNDQNVEVFQSLRQTIKGPKPAKTKLIAKEERKNNEEVIPKKRGRPCGSKNKKRKEQSQEQSQEVEQSERQEIEEQQQPELASKAQSLGKEGASKQSNKKRSFKKKELSQHSNKSESEKAPEKDEQEIAVEQKDQKKKSPSRRSKNQRSRKIQLQPQELISEDANEDRKMRKKNVATEHNEIQPQIMQPEIMQPEPEPEPEPEPDSSGSSDLLDQKFSSEEVARRATKKKPGQRKRGRPRKSQLLQQDDQEMSSRPQRQPKQRMSLKQKKMEPALDPTLIQRIRQKLGNREELIAVLNSCMITPTNVKEILDLDVSNILQEEEVTTPILNILELLRAALLYKYFPENGTYRKRYEKLSKKKIISTSAEDEEMKEPNKGLADGQIDHKQSEMRRKTVSKLQKFLKAYSEFKENAHEQAVRLQAVFYAFERELGEQYRKTAFEVLNHLKNGKPLAEIEQLISQ